MASSTPRWPPSRTGSPPRRPASPAAPAAARWSWRTCGPAAAACPGSPGAASGRSTPATPCRYPAQPPALPAQRFLRDLLHTSLLCSATTDCGGCPQEPEGKARVGIACSRQQCRTPQQAPSVRLNHGLAAPKSADVGEQPPPIFTPAGRPPQGHELLNPRVRGSSPWRPTCGAPVLRTRSDLGNLSS